MCQLP